MTSTKGQLRVRKPEELFKGQSNPSKQKSLLHQSMLTSTPPFYAGHKSNNNKHDISENKKLPKDQQPRVMWIHLQAGICTEWQQGSMLLNAASKPKTIHRCILQRSDKSNGEGDEEKLKCHVCDSSYRRYQEYYDHLINQTCANRKAIKDNKGKPTAAISHLHSPELEQFRISPIEEKESRKRKQNFDFDNASAVDLSKKKRSRTCSNCETPSNKISLIEHAADVATLNNLRVQVTALLAHFIGEDKLRAMGCPEKDVLSVLEEVLLEKRPEKKQFDIVECDRGELHEEQTRFRRVRGEVADAEANMKKFIEVTTANLKSP